MLEIKGNWRPTFWKEDIVLECSEKVAKSESWQTETWTNPRPCGILKAMVKFGFYSKYTWESFKHISLFAVQQGWRDEKRFWGLLKGGHFSSMRDDDHLHLGDTRKDIKKYRKLGQRFRHKIDSPWFLLILKLHNSNLLIWVFLTY